MNGLGLRDKLSLKIQILLGNISFLFLASLIIFYFRFIRKYRIPDLKKIRSFYRDLQKKGYPLVICPNHLTLIDSALIGWAFGNAFYYTLHFRAFPWNIPAKENVEKSLLFRIIVYLSKCILIEREGSKEHKEKVMKKLHYVLTKKHPVLIFIEGTRSSTGRILSDQIHYGAGQLLYEVPGAKALVIYFRGKKQKKKSDFPEKDQDFFVRYKLLEMPADRKGLRAHREYTLMILDELLKMEDEFFSQN